MGYFFRGGEITWGGESAIVGILFLIFRRYILCKHSCLRKGWNKAELLQPVGQVQKLVDTVMFAARMLLPKFPGGAFAPAPYETGGGEVEGAPPAATCGLWLFFGDNSSTI